MASSTPSLRPDRVGWSEAERSKVLHSYAMLDTPREEDFDDLAQIAAEVCGTPIAVVNLVDSNRQFFKAEVGLGVRETPLETSFCGTAILAAEMMIVPDATKDSRFNCNPLVTGNPKLRFYAGALLKSPEGMPIGTLCVLDYEPRQLSDQQIRLLRVLARQAMTQFELRRTLVAHQKALADIVAAERGQAMLAQLVEQSSDFIGMADLDGGMLYLNDAAQRLVGIDPGAIISTHVADYFVEADRSMVLGEVMQAAAAAGYWEGELCFRHFLTGAPIPVLYNVFPLRSGAGEIVGHGTVTKNITLQKEEEQRRAEIVQEMAHRMKNTLAMVRAIINQTLRAATSLDEGRGAVESRILALARSQDLLTANEDAEAEIHDIVRTVLAPHCTQEGRFSISGPSIVLSASQSLGLSLALHELATNATKYGALSGAQGHVAITWNIFPDGGFDFQWIETKGPTVLTPDEPGFGSRLLGKVVALYFDGEAKLAFEQPGLKFRLEGRLNGQRR